MIMFDLPHKPILI